MPRAFTFAVRAGYAAKGAVVGLPIGGLGWWLYGVAHSLNYTGPEMDPVLRHWLISTVVAFSAVGFLFGPLLALAVKDTILAVVHFEFGTSPRNPSAWLGLALLAITVAAIWFSVRGHLVSKP